MSCLFNSLSYLLKPEMDALNINNLRYSVIKYIEKNPKKTIDGVTIAEWMKIVQIAEKNDKYLEKMRHSSTWGGGPEIAIVALMFGVKIVIQKSRTERVVAVFEPDQKAIRATIYLEWTGSHHSPLKRVNHNHHS